MGTLRLFHVTNFKIFSCYIMVTSCMSVTDRYFGSDRPIDGNLLYKCQLLGAACLLRIP